MSFHIRAFLFVSAEYTTVQRSSNLPVKEPSKLLFDTIAHYFSEQGVTTEEVKQR